MSEPIDWLPFPALITEDELQRGLNGQGWFPVYRLALEVLTKSSDELAEIANQDAGANALLRLHTHVADYLQWRQTDTEVLETALARLTLVLLAHDDPRPQPHEVNFHGHS